MTRLVLVRHGESNVSVEGIVGGPKTCSGLSPLGVRQVEALRDRLAATGEARTDVLLASTLRRAVQTAEVLAPALGHLPVEQDEDLGELLPGECDGMSWQAFRQHYRPEGWVFDPYRPLSPGGESWAEFQVRAAAALSRVAHEHTGRTVVIGCHGGIVEASMNAFLGLVRWRNDTMLAPRNASLTEWELRAGEEADRTAPGWRLVRYNDVAHLAGVA